MLSPIIFFNLVLQIIGSFQSFTQAFIVSGGNGGPSNSTLFFRLPLPEGIRAVRDGLCLGDGLGLLVMIGAFTAIYFIASKFWVFYDD